MPCDGVRCSNGFCVDNEEDCKKYMDFCPLSSPVKGPSGTCVRNIIDCPIGLSDSSCGEGEFYCTRLAECVKKKSDCLAYLSNTGIEKNTTNSTNKKEEKEIEPSELKDKKSLISFIDEVKNEEKKGSRTICYDGTIAEGSEKCPIVPACKVGQYRCDNGGCASKMENCPEMEKCTDPGQIKCPDGLCHKSCDEVAFNGCLVSQYQCTNGLCVDDIYDCIGRSMCRDPRTQFRCINSDASNNCVAKPEDCYLIQRLGFVKNITYTYNKLNKIEFSFAFDRNSRTVGKLEIPANFLNLSNQYSNLYLEEVSSSMLNSSHLYSDSKLFLFNVSNAIKGSE